MKKIFLILLLTFAACLSITACDSLVALELGYQDNNYLEETADKFTDKIEENRNNDNKLIDKLDDKISKDYTWIVHKLIETK